MPKYWLILWIWGNVFGLGFLQAQTFVNGDLEGPSAGQGAVPTSWTAVGNTDPICRASSATSATSDLLSISGPNPPVGLLGIPFSGNFFVAGLDATSTNFVFGTPVVSTWHEGIQQTVSGFTPGNSYTVNFLQAVVKQFDALDPSGSWSLYVDNSLVGTSIPSTSTQAFNGLSLTWETRSINFIATSATHTLKFLPQDDDIDLELGSSNPDGALRMGIDSVTLQTDSVLPISLGYFKGQVISRGIQLTWQTLSEKASSHFEIEHSANAHSWKSMGSVEGAGNSEGPLTYQYIDVDPQEGTNYYRLRQVDVDGAATVSRILSLRFEEVFDIRIYPNPADRFLVIEMPKGMIAQELLLSDLSGARVKTPTQNDESIIRLDVSHLPAGCYVLVIKSQQGVRKWKNVRIR